MTQDPSQRRRFFGADLGKNRPSQSLTDAKQEEQRNAHLPKAFEAIVWEEKKPSKRLAKQPPLETRKPSKPLLKRQPEKNEPKKPRAWAAALTSDREAAKKPSRTQVAPKVVSEVAEQSKQERIEKIEPKQDVKPKPEGRLEKPQEVQQEAFSLEPESQSVNLKPKELKPQDISSQEDRRRDSEIQDTKPKQQTSKTEQKSEGLPTLDRNFPGLVVLGLEKSFAKRKVLLNVNLGLRAGEVVGLLGPNGAGKTTSFYVVCGLLAPDKGYVGLDKKDITHMAMYRRAQNGIGYLPQEASIFRGMSVEENILAALEVKFKDKGEQNRRLETLLEDFSIAHLRNVSAQALSGGERRRTEIARALAGDPKFILLDEPFAGVDPIALGDIRLLVQQLKERGIGVLITDHNVRETLDVVDRAYIIHNGEVLKSGTPKEIIDDETVRKVYLGKSFSL